LPPGACLRWRRRRRRRKVYSGAATVNEEEEGAGGGGGGFYCQDSNECRSVGPTRCRIALPLVSQTWYRQRAQEREEGWKRRRRTVYSKVAQWEEEEEGLTQQTHCCIERKGLGARPGCAGGVTGAANCRASGSGVIDMRRGASQNRKAERAAAGGQDRGRQRKTIPL